MIGQCGLDPELNKCQHYIRDKRGCGGDTKGCCFLEPLIKEKRPEKIKEPKWFEQFYK